VAVKEQRSTPPELAGLLERPVAVHPVYCRIAGSVDGGVLLSQLVFWSAGPEARARGGWISHEAGCIESATGVRPAAQASVRRRLVEAGVLFERRTVSGRVACKVDLERLADLVRADTAARTDASGHNRTAPCGCGDPGLAVRAAEAAARKSETRIRDSRNVNNDFRKRHKASSFSKDSKTTSQRTSSSDDENAHTQEFIASLAEELVQGRGPATGKERAYFGRALSRHITHKEATEIMAAAQSLAATQRIAIGAKRNAQIDAANQRLAAAEARSRAEGDRVLGVNVADRVKKRTTEPRR